MSITQIPLPWLQQRTGGTFAIWHSESIKSNKKAFAGLVSRAGIKTDDVVRYTIRHTMAVEMRKQGADQWEVEGWLGHKMPSSSERYAKIAPDYLSQGAMAIDSHFDEVQKTVDYPLRITDPHASYAQVSEQAKKSRTNKLVSH